MRLTRASKVLAAIFALALTSFPATAQDAETGMRGDDAARLAMLDESLGRALRQAFAEGDPHDLSILADGLRGTALPAEEAISLLPGEWICRTIKLGGNLPIVAYSDFRCRAVSDATTGTSFEKLTGSQRSRGQVHLLNGQLLYLGTGFVAGETPPDYRDLPTEIDPQATSQFVPQVGLVELTSANAGRIIFPRPHLESETDLLVLWR